MTELVRSAWLPAALTIVAVVMGLLTARSGNLQRGSTASVAFPTLALIIALVAVLMFAWGRF